MTDQSIILLALGVVISLIIVGSAAYRMLKDVRPLLKEPPTYGMVVRSVVTLTFILSYSFGFLLIVREVTTNADSLGNIEGFGMVLALVGTYVERIIDRLYQDKEANG